MRNLQFAENEIYHIYNRGVDKRIIFPEKQDIERFFDGMVLFNSPDSIGSLSRKTRGGRHSVSTEGILVRLIAYCLNPNHFHLILEQVTDKGIEKFMHKLGMGHSKYINAKYRRSGALFQGSFKAVHVDSNEYLLHASVYVNLNDRVHSYRHGVSTKSSWDEYLGNAPENICDKSIILEQFKNNEDYRRFAEESLKIILERKILIEELEDADIELVNTL